MSGTTTIDQSGTLAAVYVSGNVLIEDNPNILLDPVVVKSNNAALQLMALSTFTVQDFATLELETLLTVGAGNTFVIGNDGTIVLGSGVSAAVINDVTFGSGDTDGVLVINQGVDIPVLSGIGGFARTDAIVFNGVAAPETTGSYTDSFNGTDTNFTISLIGGGTEDFSLEGNYTANTFLLGDNLNGLTFTEEACFVPGTKILTTEGEIPVEQLAPGNIAVLADGATSKIIFIGHRLVDLRRHPRPETVSPVRIAAGALADGIPGRPLTLSPDHALFIDGVLVQAKDLVDGIVITQDLSAASIRYYHVELETHGILLAEGTPAESFLDTGHRGIFENADAPLILHPDLMQLRREAESIAPLCHDGARLTAIRATLHARKHALGLAIGPATDIALRANGETIAPVTDTLSEITFALPAGATEATIRTATFIPANFDPASGDRRRLGLALTGIVIDGASLPLHSLIHPASLHEASPGDPHHWTRGTIRLRLPQAARTLTLQTAGRAKMWTAAARAA
jgi:hypothetical protein